MTRTLKSLADLLAAEQFLRGRIPLTRAMDVRVVPHPGGFAIAAPVAPNHNHLQTAFGGSINSVATLAGYTLLWLELRDCAANLVVRESSIRFLRPIRETIRAVCLPVTAENLTAFRERLSRDGKAHFAVRVRVEEHGELAAEFHGTFVATLERVNDPERSLQPDSLSRPNSGAEDNMRFVVYMIGFLILIGGLAWAAITAGAPQLYVAIGAVILLGLGIVTGVSRTSMRPGGDVTVVRDNERL